MIHIHIKPPHLVLVPVIFLIRRTNSARQRAVLETGGYTANGMKLVNQSSDRKVATTSATFRLRL